MAKESESEYKMEILDILRGGHKDTEPMQQSLSAPTNSSSLNSFPQNERKFNSNAPDSNGLRELHIAAYDGCVLIVSILLQYKDIDVNIQSKEIGRERWTPLHYASMQGYIECVKLLLAHKDINVSATDQCGRTPMQVVQTSTAHTDQRQELIQLLASTGSETSLNTETNDTTVQSTKISNSNAFNNPSNPFGDRSNPSSQFAARNTNDMNDQRTLHVAAENGDVESLKMLLAQKDINVNAKST